MRREILFIALIGIFTASIQGQTAAFTFQGRLSDNSAAANGTYQMQFSLYDALSGGTQLGTTITNNTVTVTNGVFTVQLDFSPATPFATGADRWIEMAVRKAADPPGFTLLSPRQQVTSAPYATRAASAANADNAAQLGGVAASQYVVTTDPRMTDARPPTAGSSDYIQNQNAGAQVASNFNISGTGTANIFSAATQYNIGTSHILSNGGFNNIFAGLDAGAANTLGSNNSFFGTSSGTANTTGNLNSFFGMGSGFRNITGSSNSFFGTSSGTNNTTGDGNAFFGSFSGDFNTTGTNNTVIGDNADVGANNLTNATALGSRAFVGTSNSLVLGSINGVNAAIADTNVGIGTTAPTERLHVVGNALFAGGNVGIGTTAPQYRLHVRGQDIRVEGDTSSIFPRFSLNFTGGGTDQKKWQNYATTNQLVFSALNDAESAENGWLIVNRGTGTAISNVEFPGNVVIGASSSPDRLGVNGNVSLLLAAGGATQVCQNAANQLSTCSSSLRYKTNIGRFGLGLSLVNQLKPITFEWKDGGMKDVGFGAEDVAAIEPLLTTTNAKGEVEGVKYDRLSVVFVNAFKEQQAQIEASKKEIAEQKSTNQKLQYQIDELKKIVCSLKPDADGCKQEEK